MASRDPKIERQALDDQHQHWETAFFQKPCMFGETPSDPAQKAAQLFKKNAVARLLELGAGQGRDTMFFARQGFQVWALDYSDVAVKTIAQKTKTLGFAASVKAISSDVRKPLPFSDASFDGCYSHILYCMALTTPELEFLSDEVKRVLRPRGLNIYTARHTKDPDYGTGHHRGEDMYEVGGFVVHFSSREKVEHLARGWETLSIEEFEEGKLPRKLFRVTLRKPGYAVRKDRPYCVRDKSKKRLVAVPGKINTTTPKKAQASLENLLECEDLGLDVLHPGGFDITQQLAQLCHIGKGTSVLDVASGTGETACYLASGMGAQVFGIDVLIT